MRAVVQRVTEARVHVREATAPGAQAADAWRLHGEIGAGLLVLVGVGRDDAEADVRYVADKIRGMRVFEGDGGRPMDRSVLDVGGAVLVVSQFTLYGDVRRGRRPAFDGAADADQARRRYEDLVRELRTTPLTVATGQFQAMMRVESINDGPVTILIDSTRSF